MALPLIPIAIALAKGGILVPHAAGGMIMTSGGSYIVGTYLSTNAIAALVSSVTLATGTLSVAAATAVTGGVGVIAETAIGTMTKVAATLSETAVSITGGAAASTAVSVESTVTGLAATANGVATNAGVSTIATKTVAESAGAAIAGPTIGSFIIPLSAIGLILGGAYFSVSKFKRLKEKLDSTPKDQELQFSEKEAEIVEKLIVFVSKYQKNIPDNVKQKMDEYLEKIEREAASLHKVMTQPIDVKNCLKKTVEYSQKPINMPQMLTFIGR